MKKVLLLMLTVVMVFAMASCGKKETPSVKTEEPKPQTDVLTGTTYTLTSLEFDDGTGWQKGEIGEHPSILKFGENGAYEVIQWETDYDSEDKETFNEKIYEGTYSVDGDTLTVSLNDESEMQEEGITEEEKAAGEIHYTISGDTIIGQNDYAELSDGSEILGFKRVYTKD